MPSASGFGREPRTLQFAHIDGDSLRLNNAKSEWGKGSKISRVY